MGERLTLDTSETGTSTGALLRSLLWLAGDDAVLLSATPDGNYCVSVARRAMATAGTLTAALSTALAQIDSSDGSLTIEHASKRARVRLPEGGLGTLTRISPRARVATVRTDEGRWRHLPAASLALYDESDGDHPAPSKVRES